MLRDIFAETVVASELLAGIDVGTTATKAVLVDLSGRRIAEYVHRYPIHRPEPGAAEQDPADWMAGVLGALGHFAGLADLSRLRGIGICSQVNTHVFVDGDGKPVRRAIVWQDSRPAPDAAAIDKTVSAAEKLAWFGGPVPIDASHALSRIAYVKRTDPEAFARTRHVLLPKDYCVLQLTGAIGSDPVSAVGLVDRTGYVAPLLERVGGASALLPPLHPFHHVAGVVRAGLPGAGTPVVVGAMDAWGGMFGVGVVAEDDAMLQSGTSEIAGIVSSRVTPTPGVILFPPYEGITMHAAPTQAGGAALAWFANVLGKSPGEVAELAATAEAGSAVPLFLPHLQGERAPLWDATSRGVFARMDGRAGAAELARAVLEGVACSGRLAFEALAQSAGGMPAVISLGGGGARSDFWCQVKADVLGVSLQRASVPDAAAMGAAILAGVGAGVVQSLEAAVRGLVTYDRIFVPEAKMLSYYTERFAQYKALYQAMKPFNETFMD